MTVIAAEPRLKKSTLLKTPIWVSILTLLMLVVLSVPLIAFLDRYHTELVKQDFIEQESRVLNEQIKQKMDIGDSIALAYSQNAPIREALQFEERGPIIAQLSHINRLYAENTRFQHIQAHIITFDGRSLVKSFDLNSFNQNLTEHDLVHKVVTTGKPASGINIGGASSQFRVINIQPIFTPDSNQDHIGFIAISQGLKSIVESFKEHGVDYALLSPARSPVLNQTAAGERSFTLRETRSFLNSPLKTLAFNEAQLQDPQLHVLADRLVYTQPILDQYGTVLAAHAVAIPIDEFEQKVWLRNVDVLYILGAILLSTLTVSGLLLLVMRRSVIRPLSVFENTIKRIITSKQYTTLVEIDSNDEIGRLSAQFNALLRQMAELIQSLKYQQEAIDGSLIVSKTDVRGTITYVNTPFEQISGYASEELIGQSHGIIRHSDTPKSTIEELWENLQSGKPWRGQLKNRHKDGHAYYLASHILPILDADGRICEYMSISEDITEMVELKETLETAKIMAERANEAKSQFLSSMSHELRTPLNAIIGFSQLLALSDLSDKQRAQLENINKSGRHLLYLINDILELSRIESGQLEMSLERVSLAELIKDVLSMVEPLAKQKQVALNRPPAETLEYAIEADYTRIKQVLLNFLNNAIKYNNIHGQVFISAEPFVRDAQSWVKLHVKDNGNGIAPHLQAGLFEPFNRLGYENSNIEGTGIGLSIAKDLVEQMGGEIGMSSEPGRGADFWVAFPLAVPTAPQEQSPASRTDGGVGTAQLVAPGKNEVGTGVIKKASDWVGGDLLQVVYVEDNPSNMRLMRDLVNELEGVELTLAPSAEQGLEAAKHIVPDILFIDINLPGMNGMQLLSLLKGMPALQAKGTRFYALSANAMQEDVQKALQLGFDDYLAKPIDILEIQTLLQALRNT